MADMSGMFAMTLKAMGVDPSALIGQAQALGTAFDRLQTGQAETATQLAGIAYALADIQSSQLAIMAALGLYVPPPEGEIARLIAVESEAHIKRTGVLSLDGANVHPLVMALEA